jgi:hypothetical protein
MSTIAVTNLKHESASGNNIVLASDGKVGIGTASPAVAMDVVGQVRASTGILFGSDTAAANALDDYEEGTWTPVIKSGSNTISYSGDSLFTYTKIGRIVYLTFELRGGATSGTTGGELAIQGLPFTSTARQTGGPILFWSNGGISLSHVTVHSHINLGDTAVNSYYQNDASSRYFVPTVDAVGTPSYMFFGITYQAS